MAKRANHVFLNLPFDDDYAPLYVALVAALTAFGITPRSVLEIPPQDVRLDRLRAIILECGASIHDLSRVELSGKPDPVPRFNMPFELGLALGHHHRVKHTWFILEAVQHRVMRSLSDLNGYDALIHGGTPEGILRAVTNAFGTGGKRKVGHADLVTLSKALQGVAVRIKKDHKTLFSRAAFADLVLAAQKLAQKHFP